MNNLDLIDEPKEVGVDRHSAGALDPRQRRFIDLYFDTTSKTFANSYQSAIGAGYTDQTARNITHNKPAWYSETLGQLSDIEPAHLVLKLKAIMNDPEETTQNQLKAMDMMMKCRGMYKPEQVNMLQVNQITIESVL